MQAECTFLLALRLWLSSPCYAMSPLINGPSIRGTWSYQKGFGSTWKLPCLLLEVKRGAVVIPGSKTVQKNKHLRNVRDMFQWFHNLILLHTFYMKSYTISSVSSYVKKKKKTAPWLFFWILCVTQKSTIYFLLNPSTVIQTLELYHLMYEMTSVWVMRCNMCKQIKDIMDAKE